MGRRNKPFRQLNKADVVALPVASLPAAAAASTVCLSRLSQQCALSTAFSCSSGGRQLPNHNDTIVATACDSTLVGAAKWWVSFSIHCSANSNQRH